MLSAYFGVPATLEQTVTTTMTRVVKHAYYARVHGHRVRRKRLERMTVTRTSTVTAADPAFVGLVGAAQAYYASQPPYATEFCA